MTFTVSQNEWLHVFETLGYVALSAVVTYLLNHQTLLPLPAYYALVAVPVLQAVKYFVDGKVS